MPRLDDLHRLLPDGLPVPVDDGACAHLPGMAVPDVALVSTAGGLRSLRTESEAAWAVVFVPTRRWGGSGTSVARG